MKNKQTYEIVLTGLGMALVFVATMFIKIPNTLDGYFNLGDGFILLFASFLNPFESFLIGGLGKRTSRCSRRIRTLLLLYHNHQRTRRNRSIPTYEKLL